MFKFEVIKTAIKNNNADAFLLLNDTNRFWLTGFESSFGVIISTINKIYLFLDMRYYQKAVDNIKSEDIEIIVFKGYNQIIEKIQELSIDRLLVEKESFLIQDFLKYKDYIKTIIPFNGDILRIQKTDDEIQKLQRAADIASETLEWIKDKLVPGITEIQIANMLTSHMLELGASKNSFEPIVASGPNGAYPHHHPTNRAIENNEFVTIDMGCIYEGYCSDITRTFAIGTPDSKLIDAYKKVYESNEKGIQSIKHKMLGKEVDSICREVIDNSEFNGYFVHSTGHGVGINVHELPNVSSAYDKPLEHNSIITIEPGIYIPGLGGIRIEDMVLVKNDNNHVVLTTASKIKF